MTRPEPEKTVKLWHDDVREPPDGWRWVKTNVEAQAVLENENVVECSLDHDLGAVPTGEMDPTEIMYLQGPSLNGSGLDLVRWMVEHKKVPRMITIHSWNYYGAQEMATTLQDAGYRCTLVPYQIPA